MYAFASSIDVMLFLLPSIFMLIHKHSFRIAVESSTVFSHTFEEKKKRKKKKNRARVAKRRQKGKRACARIWGVGTFEISI